MRGLTRYGAGRVEDLCCLFQREARLFAFWTVTLPPDAAREMEARGVSWAQFQDVIRRRFSEALARAACHPRQAKARAGRAPEWLFVVESQKNGRPHLHFVYRARWTAGQRWFLSTKRLDRLIGQALSKILPGMAVNVGSAGNVQQVKRGMGRYLAKYMGKSAGEGQVRLILGAGYSPGMIPKSWWGCSAEARGLIERYTFEIPSILANYLSLRRVEYERQGMMKSRLVEIKVEGAPVVVMGEWIGCAGLRRVLESLASEAVDRLGLPVRLFVT